MTELDTIAELRLGTLDHTGVYAPADAGPRVWAHAVTRDADAELQDGQTTPSTERTFRLRYRPDVADAAPSSVFLLHEGTLWRGVAINVPAPRRRFMELRCQLHRRGVT